MEELRNALLGLWINGASIGAGESGELNCRERSRSCKRQIATRAWDERSFKLSTNCIPTTCEIAGSEGH